MTSEFESIWWPLALSIEVLEDKPLGVICGSESIVVFRGDDGIPRALENRCPHRRVPLSLGKVVADGRIQCAYHGWTFDGESGNCVRIPNLRDNETVSPRYKTQAYQTCERDGFVYIRQKNTQQDTPVLPPAPLEHSQNGRYFSGRITTGLSHNHYIGALFDGPHLLFDIAGVRIDGTVVADPVMTEGRWVMQRAAFWRGQIRFEGFIREYPLTLKLSVTPETGESWIQLLTAEQELLLVAQVSPVPSQRGTTEICWQAWRPKSTAKVPDYWMALIAQLGRSPFKLRNQVDWKSLQGLLEGPSVHWFKSAESSVNVDLNDNVIPLKIR